MIPGMGARVRAAGMSVAACRAAWMGQYLSTVCSIRAQEAVTGEGWRARTPLGRVGLDDRWGNNTSGARGAER
jgi:hypothetical protein